MYQRGSCFSPLFFLNVSIWIISTFTCYITAWLYYRDGWSWPAQNQCFFHCSKWCLRNRDDPVGEAYTQNIHPVPSDARVVCHLPRLNTHSLTLRTHPGREVPTLQEGVEQLLHHIHAKVSQITLPYPAVSLTSTRSCATAFLYFFIFFLSPLPFLTFKLSLYNQWNILCNHCVGVW